MLYGADAFIPSDASNGTFRVVLEAICSNHSNCISFWDMWTAPAMKRSRILWLSSAGGVSCIDVATPSPQDKSCWCRVPANTARSWEPSAILCGSKSALLQVSNLYLAVLCAIQCNAWGRGGPIVPRRAESMRVFIPTNHCTRWFHQWVPSSLVEGVLISEISVCSDWLEWKPAYSRPSMAHDWTPLVSWWDFFSASCCWPSNMAWSFACSGMKLVSWVPPGENERQGAHGGHATVRDEPNRSPCLGIHLPFSFSPSSSKSGEAVSGLKVFPVRVFSQHGAPWPNARGTVALADR